MSQSKSKSARQINRVRKNSEILANMYAYKDKNLYELLRKNNARIEVTEDIKLDYIRKSLFSMKITYHMTKMI